MSAWGRLLVALLAAAPSGSPRADSPAADAVRTSWAYRRAVTVSGGGELAAVAVPLEVARRSQAELRDLRLVDEVGAEQPYVIERADVALTTHTPSWSGLVDQRHEARRKSVWVVDLEAPRTFDRLDLDVPQTDFAKRLSVEVSEDGTTWRMLKDDVGIFDREWGGRLHHTHVALEAPARARWVRLTADDRRSRPIEVRGATAVATRAVAAREWTESFEMQLLSSVAGVSRYRLGIAAGTPLRAIVIDADDPAFARRAELYQVTSTGGPRQETLVTDKRLYRLRLADEALSVEDVRLALPKETAGEWVLAIHDGDSPPLRRLRGLAVGAATRLVFPVTNARLALYYGNPVTRPPLYDLDALRVRLAVVSGLAAGTLGPEQPNPRYAKAAPLPMVVTAGAAVEAARWRWSRPLSVHAEDILTLRLAPEDLASARPDLADLRIVDEKDRQVPYILDHQGGEARVDLSVAKSGGAVDPRHRALELALPGKRPLPITALEIDVSERFFSRPVRLFAPPRPGRRERELVAAVVLSRRVDGPESPTVPCRIEVDGAWRERWVLEIDEGDNAPLTIAAIRAVVRVPRVVFKSGVGERRVLIGNEGAPAPQYDLETLRREVLAYSAVAADPGPLGANSRFRRSGRDYLKHAPPTLLLWGTLVVAVLGLLFLTARILRSPPA